MSKRNVIVCDLCKTPSEEKMWKIKINKPGAKSGNQFDLCPKCSSELQTKLVSTEIIFDAPKKGSARKIIEKAELSDDELLIQEKEAAIKQTKQDEIPEILKESKSDSRGHVVGPEIIQPKTCYHMNKTGPKMGTIDGKKTMYRVCRDCHKRLPLQSLEERTAFTKGSTKNHDIKLKEDIP